MRYDIKAIETKYNGVNFRSRLEASWAAFFDLCGITWEYEPFELNGWYPDFKISNPEYGNGELLVEVKPDEYIDVELKKKINNAYKGEYLILGASPMLSGVEDPACFCHLIDSSDDYSSEVYEDYGVLNLTNHYDISGYFGLYKFRFSHEYDGDGHLRFVERDDLEKLWKEARNRTRLEWKKR